MHIYIFLRIKTAITKILLDIDELFKNLNIEISKAVEIIIQPKNEMASLWNMIEGIFKGTLN